MPPKKRYSSEDTAERNYRLEEAWRPNRLLGYNHNSIAEHLLKCGAFPIAESEFRRAIWLNPYEPAFTANLALCLHKQGREDEAKEFLLQALQQDKNSPHVLQTAVLMGISRDDMDRNNKTKT